jgi:hypothetical protein
MRPGSRKISYRSGFCAILPLLLHIGSGGARQKKTSPQLRGEAGFWSDVPVFRALQPRQTLQFYQGWL